MLIWEQASSYVQGRERNSQLEPFPFSPTSVCAPSFGSFRMTFFPLVPLQCPPPSQQSNANTWTAHLHRKISTNTAVPATHTHHAASSTSRAFPTDPPTSVSTRVSISPKTASSAKAAAPTTLGKPARVQHYPNALMNYQGKANPTAILTRQRTVATISRF
jgi:hypothetical protein